jgi:hypothetical protein
MAFHDFYKDLFGSMSDVHNINVNSLYAPTDSFSLLDEPFTGEELWQTAKNMADNKTCESDGLCAEFVQINWNSFRYEL